jgi:hypothetical protein
VFLKKSYHTSWEIQRLNIEIRRLITWIRDEDHLLQGQEASL